MPPDLLSVDPGARALCADSPVGHGRRSLQLRKRRARRCDGQADIRSVAHESASVLGRERTVKPSSRQSIAPPVLSQRVLSESTTSDASVASPATTAASPDTVAPWKRLRRLFGFARPYWRRIVVALACLGVTVALSLALPRFFGEAIDAAFTQGDLGQLDEMTAALMVIFLAQAMFVFFRHYFMSWVGERVVADLRSRVYAQVVSMPQAFFNEARTGELLSRLTDDVSRLQDTVGQDLSIGLRNLLTLIGGITLLFWLNPALTGAMLAVVPPLVISASLWGRVIRRLSRQAQDLLAQTNGTLQEGLAGIETVQAFTREDYEVNRYRNGIERTFELFAKQIRARSWFMSTTSFLAFSSIAGIFWMGGRMVATGEISAGKLAEFFLYTMAVAGAVAALSGLYGRFNQAIGATARIFELLDALPQIRDAADARSLSEEVRGEISFHTVSFAYADRNAPVIENLDLRIPPGTMCALVGTSGSGKTTLGRLILRFWDPTEGSVRLDGHDLRTLKLEHLRLQIATVSQDPVLFSGSIRENIRYGRLDATDDEIEAAARAANADGFVRGFPDGYETVVGERGVKLSGGQRQRVSIARAILRDPRILILDEATSALDAQSEAAVQGALEKLQRGRTTVVIAHRLSTIRDADNIVVLEHGRIVEQGRHSDLMARQGSYSRLVARQTRPAGAPNTPLTPNTAHAPR
ncbi:MAG: ABC transporter ATP-binding protein [Nannocystaceae bacterium]